QDATIKPLQKDIRVKNIALESLYLKVKRDIKGEIDWLEYIKSNADNSASTNKEQNTSKVQKSEPWSVLLENISLQKIKVDFYDKGVRPQVDTKLNEMNIHVKNITLAGIEPFLYEMNMKMNENFKCTSKGSIKHQVLDAQTYSKCSGFDFVHYRPYIDAMAKKSFQTHDVKLESAQSSFDANVSVWDIDSQWIVNVNDANFNLTQFALSKKSTKEELVKFSSFDMSGVRLNTKSREVVIQKTSLENLDIQTSRLKEGTLNIENLIVPHPQSVSSHSLAESKKEKEFKILLKHFALKSSRISFNDKLFSPSILTQIDTINVNAYEIDSQINSRFKYDARLRINNSGTVKSSGAIQHTPFEQNGVFELQKLSLKEFTPYVQENAYLKIDDGFLSLKTKTKYSKNVEDADLKVDGSLHLEGLFINDSRDESSLLSLSDLKLNAFTYEMFPNRLFINSIDLNSFYVNAIIDEKKNMNFASLMKKKAEENSTQVPHAKENETKQEFPIKIMKLNVDMGSAHFADLSLPIQFKTHIHDLKGSVYSLSNIAGETSYVDVAGEIDRYGSTQLKGSINAGDPKSYTDLDFNFKNLELNSLSGYSANFAGYKIDKGKLYIDLGYKILDSELVGKNSIVIKNIELGEEMKDENITSLPLGLAVALLEDRDGIIDINMPVEGNIDEPDFKYGALLLKTLGNLIVKAVSAPFKALGSMLGMDAEGLEYIEFESGLVHILPPEKEKLDNISMMMIKRPKISLSIRGKYDEITDKEALQKEKLIALVIKKSGRKNKENHETAMTRELLENIYGDFGADGKVLNAMKIELKKRYKDKAFEREYLNSLIRECIKVQPLAKEELLSLAQKRAEELSSYLVGEKGVEISRIEILDADSADGKSDRFVKTKLDIIVK
ncbi:DUF748 domain-containing protein, partial [bacterium]|nr:DUF748 domain-containing protein [bacterium]